MRKPRKWQLYLRVSTPFQKDVSTLGNQEKAIRQLWETEGYTVEPEDRLHDQGSGGDTDPPDSPPTEQ